MKINFKTLAFCIAVPLLVGVTAGLISRGGMELFETLSKPQLSPPGWLFPVVWTVLYILMGLASYLVLSSGAPQTQVAAALKVYALQLFFNFLWSFLFFNRQLYSFSFVWLVALWLLIIVTTVLFYRVSKPAAYLMLPYLLWVTFAGYLNLSIAMLN